MEKPLRQALTDYLGQFVTETKKERMRQVLEQRTRRVTVVMEDFENSHNGSAVLRTCEAMGIQDVHFIENHFKNRINPYIARGGGKWLNVHRHRAAGHGNTSACLNGLRDQGFAIWVTEPSPDACDITKLEVGQKIALVFGTEYKGISVEAKSFADKEVFFPMYGFTESFNVSVSVALCLQVLLKRLRSSSLEWRLTPEEKDELTLEWYRKMVRRSDLHEQQFLAKKSFNTL